MASVLTYLVQINVLFAILTIGYYLLLRKLTFYKLNRIYFLGGILFSLVYPFLPQHLVFKPKALGGSNIINYSYFIHKEEGLLSDSWTIGQGFVVLLLIVGAVFVLKFIIQLCAIWRIYRHSEHYAWGRFLFRNVRFPIAPFSFLQHIYVHKPMHEEEALQNILEHESVHVEGRHTVDMLFTELLLACCWYNPFVWMLRHAMRQNLEFLTDEQVLAQGVNRQNYQYALLLETQQCAKVGIANNFNYKQLKTRISMMNKQRSARIALTSYVLLVPILMATAGAFTVKKADSSIKELVFLAQETPVSAILPQDTLVPKAQAVGIKGAIIAVQEPAPEDGEGTDRELRAVRTEAADSINKVIPGDPIFIVGEEEFSKNQLAKINPNDIASMTVYKDTEAYNLYGERGKNGVVKILLKAHSSLVAPVDSLQKDAERAASYKDNAMLITKEEGEMMDSFRTLAACQPVFFVDGKEMSKSFSLKNIDEQQIESMHVIKGQPALLKYGHKATYGAVEIVLKKQNPN